MDGVEITERTKRYNTAYSAGKPFSLFLLPSYIQKHKEVIENNPNLKRELGKIRDLFKTVKNLPVVLKALLKAHDVVRKLKGKEIVYGFRPLTIENSEEVINKMHSHYDVDLAHAEIDKIVTEVDSFSNIAKSLGISEEIVYQVKAQFR